MKLIAAVSQNGVIGDGNTIPWYVPEDFKHFKRTTLNHSIIMGSSTWISLPVKPLPMRENIVISGSNRYDNAIMATSINDAVSKATMPIMFIGGASIYEQVIDIVDELIISEINIHVSGDKYFPNIPPEWRVSEQHSYDGFTVKHYQRC